MFVANDLDVAGAHLHTPCAPIGFHERVGRLNLKISLPNTFICTRRVGKRV
jgi:hypothetical protein